MKIANILHTDLVVTNLSAKSKQEAINQLVSALAEVRKIDPERALKDIAAREHAGSILVPVGSELMALPHASSKACQQIVIAAGISPEGISWGSADQVARLVFVLLGPPQAHALYLRCLGRLARLCRAEDFANALLNAKTSHEVIALFRDAEEPLGEMASAEAMPKFCVLGAGHGGMAMAGHLSLMGCKVHLFNRTHERLAPVIARGGIEVTGQVEGFAPLHLITSDPQEAVQDADVLMVVVPATGHRSIVEAVAPHVKDGQILVLNPGRTGGALEAARILRERNPKARVFIGEAQTLLYASRVTNPGLVHILRIKNSVPIATLPAYDVTDILPVIHRALPQFVPGDNVLKTSFDNIGAVFHPSITILNAARIEESHGDFDYYTEGVSRAVASVLEAVDEERVAVAGALGIRANTAREWLYLAYDAAGKTLLDAMHANAGYAGIKAPRTVQHRYITEDVPASLVPLASIGDMLNVPTPTIHSMIHIASVMHGVDYWAEGRTVESLGIKGMSVKDIRLLVVGAEVTPTHS